MTHFSDLNLIEPLHRALRDVGYETPTPIQAQSIPALLEGRDLLGCAQTGTGKTAAFALPTLQRLAAEPRRPAPKSMRALVLTPTRELALQVEESVRTYGRHLALTSAVIFGGVGQTPQVRTMAKGVDILVATPGRLLDLFGQGHLRFDAVEVFVLDEADRMLDMGFIHDVRKVIKALPAKRQSLFFSATLPGAIVALAKTIVHDPVKVEVSPGEPAVDRIDQRLYYLERGGKPALLRELLAGDEVDWAIVFTRTKHGANRLVRQLGEGEAIHGNKSQNARVRALENFRNGHTRVLVATDIAARGIDVDGITHVVNYDLPNEPESYVHRIGRTARAGSKGTAISFCQPDEQPQLAAIERLLDRAIPVHGGEPAAAGVVAQATARGNERSGRGRGPGGGRGRGPGGRSQGRGGSGGGRRRGGRGGQGGSHDARAQ